MEIVIDGVAAICDVSSSYLQLNDVDGAALSGVWPKLATDYAGFDKWLCYHNSPAPVEFLEEIGAVIVDDCVEMRATSALTLPRNTLPVRQIGDHEFDAFAVHHDKQNAEMYWNSERIRRDSKDWAIFTVDRPVTGYLLLSLRDATQAEIFSVDACSQEACEALLSYAAACAFQAGRREVLYMADVGAAGVKAALQIGFVAKGHYQGYRVKRTQHTG